MPGPEPQEDFPTFLKRCIEGLRHARVQVKLPERLRPGHDQIHLRYEEIMHFSLHKTSFKIIDLPQTRELFELLAQRCDSGFRRLFHKAAQKMLQRQLSLDMCLHWERAFNLIDEIPVQIQLLGKMVVSLELVPTL